ncbi:MAG: hypothetical protein IIY70_01505, partial [Oscillospiraceae bacterium]|nr:hypothetical protein [Oscillospiraceae bacterium]
MKDETWLAEYIGYILSSGFPPLIYLITVSAVNISSYVFSCGFIKNKILSGASRTGILLSAVCGGIFQGVMLSLLSFLSSVAVAFLFADGNLSYSVPEIAKNWIVITMASGTVAAFCTALVIMLGGSELSNFIDFALLFLVQIASPRVVAQLYPADGLCSLTGTKLAVYTFLDKFFPYFYFTATPHYPMGTYVLGCGGLILISAAIGLLVFNKRDLK